MAVKNPSGTDPTLPFPALQLLAPPMRLVSAALFKVMKQRDVLQYGTVEEFVTSACETVPGLLTHRHQGKLALGLRARLILELCRGKDPTDPALITLHLERIRTPASPTRRDVKVETAVINFKMLIETLLRDPEEKEHFFQEEFPVDYGPQFDEQLEKLLWEFLIRLDQFLPVPNLAQTVSWLSAAPPVLEECAKAATQPQLLMILLQHQTCLGHMDCAASLPPFLGDSILTSLSLMPSGRVVSDPPSELAASCRLTPRVSPPAPQTAHQTARDVSQPVTPVIAPTSGEDMLVMSSANGGRPGVSRVSCSPDEARQDESQRSVGNKFTGVRVKRKAEEMAEDDEAVPKSGTKRKQVDEKQADSDDHHDDDDDEKNMMIISRSWRKGSKNRSGLLGQRRQLQRQLESDGDGADASCGEGQALRGYVAQLGLPRLTLPQDPSLLPALASCLRRQPRVLVDRLSTASPSAATAAILPRAGSYGSSHDRRELLAVTRRHRKSSPWLNARLCDEEEAREDKENCGVSSAASRSPSLQMRNTETVPSSGDGEEIIGDSEDEGTKNFKGRLFMKRYYKTKYNTYIPTLREFWKPGMVRLDLLSPLNGHR